MRAENLRLVVALVFAAMAVLLHLRHVLIPEVVEHFREGNLELGAWLATLLSGWNVARWYMARSYRQVRERAVRRPFRHDPEPTGPVVPNPDFDFVRLPDIDRGSPGPSANGDHK